MLDDVRTARNLDQYVGLFNRRLLLAAELFRRPVTVKADRPETSPLRAIYADWEERVHSALLRHWGEKSTRLIERLEQDNRKAIDDVIADLDWWEEWTALYLGVISGEILAAGQIGAGAGMEILEVSYALGVDADVVNPAVAEWARKHAGLLAKGLTRTDRRLLRTHLAAWVESHEDFSSLVRRVNGFLNNPSRAEMIAVTEATQAYAEGNLVAWRSSDVVTGKIWNTALDESVCFICEPLHGQIAELDGQEWKHPRQSRLHVGLSVSAPPAHPRCRCFLAPFTDEVPA